MKKFLALFSALALAGVLLTATASAEMPDIITEQITGNSTLSCGHLVLITQQRIDLAVMTHETIRLCAIP